MLKSMMTEDGKIELYLYSLKKMADRNAEVDRYSLTGLYGNVAFFIKQMNVSKTALKYEYEDAVAGHLRAVAYVNLNLAWTLVF